MKKRSNDRSERRGEGEENLVPGRKALVELVRQRPGAIRAIYRVEGLHLSADLKSALADAEARSIRIVTIGREELDELAPGIAHQGILTAVAPRTPVSLSELIERSRGRNNLILALDEIHDPQNLGALLRVADACGADGVIVPERRAVHLTPAVRKISAGAAEFVPLSVVKNLAQAVRELKDEQFWILGTALGPDCRDLYEVEPAYPLVVIIGSEGDGLRPLTRSLCDFLVRIPMQGSIQSLNASHAAAIVLSELQRRRASACPEPGREGI